ncbi:hypothetical protein HK096_005410, partial [Nowakowskiella sp. JEL0078]
MILEKKITSKYRLPVEERLLRLKGILFQLANKKTQPVPLPALPHARVSMQPHYFLAFLLGLLLASQPAAAQRKKAQNKWKYIKNTDLSSPIPSSSSSLSASLPSSASPKVKLSSSRNLPKGPKAKKKVFIKETGSSELNSLHPTTSTSDTQPAKISKSIPTPQGLQAKASKKTIPQRPLTPEEIDQRAIDSDKEIDFISKDIFLDQVLSKNDTKKTWF